MWPAVTSMVLGLAIAQLEPIREISKSSTQTTQLYAGILTGAPTGIELSYLFTERIFGSLAGGGQNGDRGSWLATTDIHYLFADAMGSVGSWGRLLLYAGLGAQAKYQGYEDPKISYGGRASLGIKFVVDDGKYEMFTAVTSGLYYKPRLRASLDTLFGLRLRVW